MIFAGLALLSVPAAVPPHEDAASCELDAQCTSAVWTVERWTEAVNEHDWSASVLEPTGPTAVEYADAVLVWTELAAWAPSPGGVDLWVILGVFSGPDAHTSALCVRWFYDASKDTLTEISRGLAAFERDGFLQPGDMMPELDLVFECSAFDMPVGLESALPATIVFDGQRYACQNVGFTDYDCVSYSGLEPPQAVASVDLRCSGSVLASIHRSGRAGSARVSTRKAS